MSRKQGAITISQDGNNWQVAIVGIGATALGVGIAVSCVLLSAQIGLTLTLVGGGLGLGIAATGVGEGIRRARLGRAAEIAAKAQLVGARQPRLINGGRE